MESVGLGRVERWAGPLAGIVGAVTTMAGIVLTDYANLNETLIAPSTSGSTIVKVLDANRDRIELGTSLLMIGLFLLVWFLVHLQTRLNPDGTTRWVASVASVGGLIAVALMALIVADVRASLLTAWLRGENAVIAKGFAVYSWDYFSAFAPFFSAHLLAAGIAIARTRLLPRLIGWGAIAVAFVPLVLPPGLMTPSDKLAKTLQ